MAGMEPLLGTLDIYDRKLGLEREPFEAEILITLDILERGRWAKSQQKTPEPAKRGNRR